MSCGLREKLKEEPSLFTWVIQPCEGGARSFGELDGTHGAAVCTGTSQLAAEQLGRVFAPAI